MAGINDHAQGGGKPVDIEFVIWDGNRDAQQALASFREALTTRAYENVKTEVGEREMDLARWFNEMGADERDNAAWKKEQDAKKGIAVMKPIVIRKR